MKKKGEDMPRVDLVGEEALQKALGFFGAEITNEKTLYRATLASDVISNAFYYSAIGSGDPRYVWPRAITYGLAAGVGAVTLPEPMGLDDEPVTRSGKTKALTVAYYVAGALVTGLLVKALGKKGR